MKAKDLIDGYLEETPQGSLAEGSWVVFTLDLKSMNPAWNSIEGKFFDISANGALITPRSDDAPIPMDAGIEVKGSDIVLEGSVDVGGFGHCIAKYPKGRAGNYFTVEIEATNDDDARIVKGLLDRARIKYKVGR